MTDKKTEGLIAAPFTPLRADRTLNLNAVDQYARWLHTNGVVGAFICGTTGEGSSLTMEDRRQVAERWVAAAPAGLRVIVHVGGNCLADCRALAAHAQSIGADRPLIGQLTRLRLIGIIACNLKAIQEQVLDYDRRKRSPQRHHV